MINKQQKLRKKILQFQDTDNLFTIVGSIVATLIGTSYYSFLLYESVSSKKTWNTFLFTSESSFQKLN